MKQTFTILFVQYRIQEVYLETSKFARALSNLSEIYKQEWKLITGGNLIKLFSNERSIDQIMQDLHNTNLTLQNP